MNRLASASLAIALGCAPAAFAQEKAPEKVSPSMPKPAPAKPFAFPKAVTKTLPNGLRVFVVSNSELPALSVRLVLTAAGSANDPAGKPGVANLAADMLTQGTGHRSAQQIAEAIDFVGGTLGAGASTDDSNVNLTVVKKDLKTGLALLADVVRNASFQDEELNRRRKQLLSNLQVQYADGGYVANLVFDRKIFGNHPYGLPGEGTPQSVRTITRDDLVKFRDERYVPQHAMLAFAGDITAEAAFAAAEEYFGNWSGKDAGTAAIAAPRFTSGVHITLVDKPDAAQSEIRVGRGGIPRNHPDYIPLLVTNRIFGGGYNSRLSVEVRIKKGLTYGAYSGFASNKAGGSFSAATSTRTEATTEATKLIVDLIQKMSTGEATPDELNFARDYLVGVFPLQSETPGQVAGRVLAVQEYGLPADYYDVYREKIATTGPADVKRMAGQYFSTRDLEIVVIGNLSAFRDSLKKEFPGATYGELAFDQVDILAADLRKPKEAAAAASPESMARAKEILSAAIEASGGAALGKVSGVAYAASGEIVLPQGAAPLTVKATAQFPSKFWVELNIADSFLLQQGYDGKSTWQATPQGVADLPAFAAQETQRVLDLLGGFGIYRMAAAGQLNASFSGEKDFQGKKTLAVDWQAEAGKTTLFFDAGSHLLIGAAYKARTAQGETDTVTIWSDHRPVDGVQYPHHLLTLRDGAKFTEQQIKEVKFSPAVDAKIFAKP